MGDPWSTPAIHAEALTKRYAAEPLAVEALSFTLPRGATWGLLGGNGAGKTTTIAMLLGLLVPSRRAGRGARPRHGAGPLRARWRG